ncbi:MAG: 50S ribosomal protein L21 [Candidatus Nomurabacteria bacterium GW2011_GWB1_37_5]|uniref:Large ribosomal subunit protein bL21 n=1 Tax=Candidatus Nomurabacteria bacterium GW2011_GWB1_37_5 TaxID=1618742 RepID=A0A0G0GSQ8_9BACT|nr:MAG: 50S ribosomal protein L21 [Candidatus Nomurabacteria bacterium GW2011_GWB1_37_5]
MANTKTTTKKATKPVPAKSAVNKDEFAVIETGGKQYQVSVGDVLKVEKIKGDYKEGDSVVFDKVLLVDDGKDASIGMPYITGAKVEAELVEIGRLPKVTVIKYKAKSRYFKKRGHRQPFFKIKIISIK